MISECIDLLTSKYTAQFANHTLEISWNFEIQNKPIELAALQMSR